MLRPDFMCVKEEMFDENISVSQNEIDCGLVDSKKWIIKEETNELVLTDDLASLLHEVKQEKPEFDATCNQNVQISDNSATFSTENKNISTKIKLKKSFICKICSKSFSNSLNLSVHRIVHSKKKIFTCEVCNKSFGLSSNLGRHKLIHTGEKPLTCDVCNKSFRHSSSLNRHKLVHTGEKPFTCNICSKSFRELADVKQHEFVHYAGKQFTCDACNRSFKHPRYLKKHKISHN